MSYSWASSQPANGWQLALVLLAIIRGSFLCPNKNVWFEAALTERHEIHWLAHIIKRPAYRVNGNQVFSISPSSQNTESTKWSSIKPQIRYDCIVVESSSPTVVGKIPPMCILGHRSEDDWEGITTLADRANQWDRGE
jgi:hypothetical protein